MSGFGMQFNQATEQMLQLCFFACFNGMQVNQAKKPSCSIGFFLCLNELHAKATCSTPLHVTTFAVTGGHAASIAMLACDWHRRVHGMCHVLCALTSRVHGMPSITRVIGHDVSSVGCGEYPDVPRKLDLFSCRVVKHSIL